jgi:hypothetical protein
MENRIIKQLVELAEACQKKDIKPIVCGGLGVYLSFCEKEGDIQQMLRATQDIDLMLSKQDLLEEAKRNAMAEIITGELEYVVQEGKKHFGFRKEPDQELDILAPPMEDLERNNYRLSIVKSTLHAHITEEAEYTDEDLREISLSETFDGISTEDNVIVYVPCPTNLMIMKLYAFSDRIEGKREGLDRAMAHAFDVYITIMLTNREDFKEGQGFLSRHIDSDIILKTKSIIKHSFSNYEKVGWQTILNSPNFHSTLNIGQKQEKLQDASARLFRWFGIAKE